MDVSAADTIGKSYVQGHAGTNLTAFARVLDFIRDSNASAPSTADEWAVATFNCAQLYAESEPPQWNKVLTTIRAARVVVDIALNLRIGCKALTKLEQSAESNQKVRCTAKGTIPTVTMPIFKVLRFIDRECKRVNFKYHKIDYSNLQRYTIFLLRLFTAGRPQDPGSMFEGIATFVDGKDYGDCTAVSDRIYQSKDTRNANYNKNKRARCQQQLGELSSAFTIDRPRKRTGRPDYFAIIATYMAAANVQFETNGRLLHDPVVINMGDGKSAMARRPLFFYYQKGCKHARRYTRERMSKITLQLMIDAGAVQSGSPLKAEHIRHTSLSFVYHMLPKQMEAHLRDARHSSDSSFNSSYHLRVDDESFEHYKTFKATSATKISDMLLH